MTTTDCAPLVPVNATVAGRKLQVAFCGRFLQENASVPVYPPTGVTVMVSVAELPGATLRDVLLGTTVTDGG